MFAAAATTIDAAAAIDATAAAVDTTSSSPATASLIYLLSSPYLIYLFMYLFIDPTY